MLSKFQWGFCKGFNALHFLLLMIKKWGEVQDNGEKTGAVLTDLSKAFHCINYNLLIAKFNAYDVEKSCLGFIHFDLTRRRNKQKTK